MKKLLLVLAIGAFAACNDSSTSTETPLDSAAVTVDTNTLAPVDTATVAPVDSAAAKVDSAVTK